MTSLPPGLTEAEVKRDAPLAPWTSVRVGGAAEVLLRPASPDALVAALRFARDEGVPLTILGGGANTLVGDLGVPGFTVKLPRGYFEEALEPTGDGVSFTLNGSAGINRVATVMKKHALVGAEFLAGIPGTIGGAIAMNAGTRQGEAMTCVEAVELATPDGLGWVTGLRYRYRHTELPAGAVVTRARFRLVRGDVEASQARMDAELAYRKRTQPLSQPNFGSVFTNPPGEYAGRLIEGVGLKGHRVGGAQISERHANWIVNLGGATAADVTALMALACARVLEATGVTLTPEVKRVGGFR